MGSDSSRQEQNRPESEFAERTPTIALIGTEGSGKTVLTTTLAKRLSTIDSRGVFLNPQGAKTLKYVEDVWATLQRGEWPPSTPPGERFELRWKLEIVGEMASEIHLVDIAGQDLRLLFGDDQYEALASLPESLRELAEYCRSADIVLFLVNFADFLGEGDSQQRTENQAAIKAAMDYLSTDGESKRFCLVFTQSDLYEPMARKHGSWHPLVQEAIPYIYSAYVKTRRIKVFFVSAVSDTTVHVDDAGVPRRKPIPGFGSRGFTALLNWVTKEVRNVHERLATEVPPLPYSDSILRAVNHWRTKLDKPLKAIATAFIVPLAMWFVIRLLMLFVFLMGGLGPKADPPASAPSGPQPFLIENHDRDNPGLFDDGVIAFGTVRNEGTFGRIVVEAWVTENGKEVERRNQVFYLNHGEQADFYIELNDIQNLRNLHRVDTRVYVP